MAESPAPSHQAPPRRCGAARQPGFSPGTWPRVKILRGAAKAPAWHCRAPQTPQSLHALGAPWGDSPARVAIIPCYCSGGSEAFHRRLTNPLSAQISKPCPSLQAIKASAYKKLSYPLQSPLKLSHRPPPSLLLGEQTPCPSRFPPTPPLVIFFITFLP